MYDPLVVDVFIQLHPKWPLMHADRSEEPESAPLSIGLPLPVKRA
jgi:hypothetical protein